MLISAILVTHAPRRPWLAAWAQQIRRQTYRPLQTVIVDASPEPLGCLPDVPHLDYHHLPGATIGAQRNRGLLVAKGAYLAWFDDDDAHEPHRLALLHTRMGGSVGADVATPTRLALVDTRTRLGHIFTQSHHPINSSALYRTAWVKPHRFPERQGAGSDTPWLQAIMPGAKVVRVDELLTVAWCHTDNISNRVVGSRWVFDQEISLARAQGLMTPKAVVS